MEFDQVPKKVGLYDPVNERDSCGVGFIVSIEGASSHKVLQDASTMLIRMDHRGGCGCDDETGDGAGVLTNIPHSFFHKVVRQEKGVELPKAGEYAVGVFFMTNENETATQAELENICAGYNLSVAYWRTVPVDSSKIGEVARKSEPLIKQAFIIDCNSQSSYPHKLNFKQRCYIARKRTTHAYIEKSMSSYISSFSQDTIIYKVRPTTFRKLFFGRGH